MLSGVSVAGAAQQSGRPHSHHLRRHRYTFQFKASIHPALPIAKPRSNRMSPESALFDTARLAQLLFLSVFSVSVGLVLRVAHDWFPFTPTYTEDQQWMGWRDVLRWASAGILLWIVPFAYLAWALVAVTQSGITVPLHFPSVKEIAGILVLILLPIPLLGFYDIWQSIVRTWPTLLYSPHAIATIEERYRTAFTSGQFQALLLGFAWIVGPVMLFHVVSTWLR